MVSELSDGSTEYSEVDTPMAVGMVSGLAAGNVLRWNVLGQEAGWVLSSGSAGGTSEFDFGKFYETTRMPARRILGPQRGEEPCSLEIREIFQRAENFEECSEAGLTILGELVRPENN